MSHLRMDKSMHHLAVDHQTAADARADRHIQQAGKSLARAHRMLRQCSGVHVRVDARRHAERLLKRTQQRIVNPTVLGVLVIEP